MRISSCSLFALLLSLAACSNASESGGAGGSSASSTGSSIGRDPPGPAGCTGGVLEADLKDVSPLHGTGVDPSTHLLMPLPSTAVMSTTYLALRPEMTAQQRFGDVLAPILPMLGSQPGLLGVKFARSASCGSARTLSVWKDDMTMFAFVATSAHTNAAQSVGDISRGGSAVTSWPTTKTEDATWEVGVAHLAQGDGPYY